MIFRFCKCDRFNVLFFSGEHPHHLVENTDHSREQLHFSSLLFSQTCVVFSQSGLVFFSDGTPLIYFSCTLGYTLRSIPQPYVSRGDARWAFSFVIPSTPRIPLHQISVCFGAKLNKKAATRQFDELLLRKVRNIVVGAEGFEPPTLCL